MFRLSRPKIGPMAWQKSQLPVNISSANSGLVQLSISPSSSHNRSQQPVSSNSTHNRLLQQPIGHQERPINTSSTHNGSQHQSTNTSSAQARPLQLPINISSTHSNLMQQQQPISTNSTPKKLPINKSSAHSSSPIERENRLRSLATPSARSQDRGAIYTENHKDRPYHISPAALNYQTSQRIASLAMPPVRWFS